MKKTNMSVSETVVNHVEVAMVAAETMSANKGEMDMDIKRVAEELAKLKLEEWIAERKMGGAVFMNSLEGEAKDDDGDEVIREVSIEVNNPEMALMVKMGEVAEVETVEAKPVDEVVITQEQMDRQFKLFVEREIAVLTSGYEQQRDRELAVNNEARANDGIVTTQKLVTVRNFFEVEGGVRYWVKEKQFGINQFSHLFETDMIQAGAGTVVSGYTDLQDIEVEDFNDAEKKLHERTVKVRRYSQKQEKWISQELVQSFRDKTLEIDHGKGFVEEVLMDDVLNNLASGGYKDKIRILNNTEIRYGLAQEGYDLEDTQIEEDGSEEPMGNTYNYRAENEKLYYGRKLMRIFNGEFGSYAELRKAAEGILFPTTYTSLKGITHKEVWMLPANAIEPNTRKELMDIFKDIAEQFRVQGKELLNAVKELDKKSGANVVAELKQMGVDAAAASTVIALAVTESKNNGGQRVLSTRMWGILNSIKRGERKDAEMPIPSDDVKQLLEQERGIKFVDSGLRAEAVKGMFNKEQALKLLEYGKLVMGRTGQMLFDRATYGVLVELSKR